jgi:enamine deaminase RidA (YjgF/YER057c/UK114 family)
MENMSAILKGHNLNMDDVVKCTVMLTDMSKWADFNRIYTGYFLSGYRRAVPWA